jgi:hypothetical protein
VKFLDFGVEVVKGREQTPGQVVALGQKGVPLGPEDAQIEFAVEERDFEAPSLEVPLDDEPKKAREPLVVRKAGTGQHAANFRADRERVDRNHGREDRGFSERFIRSIPRFYALRLAGGEETSDRAPSMACRCTGTKCQALWRS